MELIKAIETRVGDELIRYELRNRRVVLGRAASCDLTLPDPSISRQHAEIRFEDGSCILSDLGSANGTLLNGKPLAGSVAIKPNDRITLASIDLTLITDATTPPPPRNTELTLTDLRQTTGAEISWTDVAAWRTDREDRRDRLLKMMLEAAAMIQTSVLPESLHEPLLDLIERAFNPDRILLIRAEDHARPVIAASRFTDLAAGSHEIVLSRSIVKRVLEEKVALLVEDAAHSADTIFDSVVELGVHSALAVPLLDEDRVVGLIWADSRRPEVRYRPDDLKAFTLLAGVFGHALTQARMNVNQKELRRLETELDTARDILATILPTTLPDVPGYEVCAHLDSCYEVGGDLYQLRPLPDGRLLMVNGDVAGKGLGAALLVATILPVLGVVCEKICDPVSIMTGLNQHIWRLTDTTRFATLFIGILDPATGGLIYVNAGHNPPFIVDPDGSLRTLEPTGLPVGMFEDATYGVTEDVLTPGASLVLYSDGISEADAGGVFYGEKRFAEVLRRSAGCSAPQLLGEALCDLAEFMGDKEPGDDITLVIVKRLAASTHAAE